MRGKTLAELRFRLRGMIGQTLNTSAAQGGDEHLNLALAEKQIWLAGEFDWPFLQQRWDLPIAAGVRYVAVPGTPLEPHDETAVAINWDRSVTVEVKYGNKWLCLSKGIGASEFNWKDSDEDATGNPIMAWRMASNLVERTDVDTDMIEVWPIPSVAQTIRFTGQRQLLPLYDYQENAADNDENVADLDDILLLYLTAAEILAVLDQKDAQIKNALGMRRLQMLRGNLPNKTRRVILGKGCQDDSRRRKHITFTTPAQENALLLLEGEDPV
jgi:hypothetical protein